MNRITEAPFAAAAGTTSTAGAVGRAHVHESAHLHVTGTATYVDDLPELAGTLHAALGLSPVAHGRLRAIAVERLRALPGVVAVVTAADIPGTNDCGPIVHDDPILAPIAEAGGAGTLHYLGQPMFAVLARAATPRDARPHAQRSSATSSRSSRC